MTHLLARLEFLTKLLEYHLKEMGIVQVEMNRLKDELAKENRYGEGRVGGS
jgi:hypothetical protein